MLTKSKIRAASVVAVVALTGAGVSVFGGGTSSGDSAHPLPASRVNAPASVQPASGSAYWAALKANAHPYNALPYEGPH